MVKRQKTSWKKEKQKYKAYFKGETSIITIEMLTRDIIKRCKLPDAIEFRKNQDIITTI